MSMLRKSQREKMTLARGQNGGLQHYCGATIMSNGPKMKRGLGLMAWDGSEAGRK